MVGLTKILDIANKSESKVFVAGHSGTFKIYMTSFNVSKYFCYLLYIKAGAHLASIILYSSICNRIQPLKSFKNLSGLILVSGVYDLTPLIETEINDNLKLNLQIAQKYSPISSNNLDFNHKPSVLIAYGEDDSSAFKKQSIDYEQVFQKYSKIQMKVSFIQFYFLAFKK